MKQILIRRGENKELQKIFGVSEVTVTYALMFRRNTDLCKKIRATALKRGGALVDTNKRVSNIIEAIPQSERSPSCSRPERKQK